MTREGIRQSYVLTLCAFLVAGVLAHVANQQTEKAIVVIVKENCSRGMADQIEAGRFGDVREMPMAVIFE